MTAATKFSGATRATRARCGPRRSPRGFRGQLWRWPGSWLDSLRWSGCVAPLVSRGSLGILTSITPEKCVPSSVTPGHPCYAASGQGVARSRHRSAQGTGGSADALPVHGVRREDVPARGHPGEGRPGQHGLRARGPRSSSGPPTARAGVGSGPGVDCRSPRCKGAASAALWLTTTRTRLRPPQDGLRRALASWLRKRGDYAEQLLDRHAPVGAVLERREVRRLLLSHRLRVKDESARIWRLLVLHAWFALWRPSICADRSD